MRRLSVPLDDNRRIAGIPDCLAVITIAILVVTPVAARAQGDAHASKLDRVVRRLAEHADQAGTHRVIIRTKSGYRGLVAGELRAHGDSVRTEHRFIEALTADL